MVSSSFTPLRAHRIHRPRQIVRAKRDVLDALAVVHVQVLLDLPGLFVALFVDRDADLAAGAGHGLALDAGDLALDVEVAHLAEVEQALVEIGPLGHAAAVHVVRQVVDVGQAVAGRVQLLDADAGQRLEVDVEEADVADVADLRAVLAAPAVDEIDQAVADALDGRECSARPDRPCRRSPRRRARLRARRRRLRVLHAEGDGADARAVQAREALRKRVGLGIDDEVDLALAVQHHVLVAVPRDRLEAHALEQGAHRRGVGRGVFDELEAVGAHRVVPGCESHVVSLSSSGVGIA